MVNYQLLVVITEVAQWGTPSCSQPQTATENPIDWSHPLPSWAVPPEHLVQSINRCSSATTGIRSCNLATFSMRGNHLLPRGNIYRGRLSVVDVPRLQTESGQIAPTSPSAPSHSAWSSAPWGLLRYPRKPNNLLLLSGSARPDRPLQNNNNNNNNLAYAATQSMCISSLVCQYSCQCASVPTSGMPAFLSMCCSSLVRYASISVNVLQFPRHVCQYFCQCASVPSSGMTVFLSLYFSSLVRCDSIPANVPQFPRQA